MQFFPSLKTAVPRQKIQFTRAIAARLKAGGPTLQFAVGDQAEIEVPQLRELDSSDFKLLGKSPVAEVSDPTPARPLPEPLPKSWEGLPDCFAKYHSTAEELRTASAHLRLLREERYRVTGIRGGTSAGEGPLLAMSFHPADPTKFASDVIYTRREIDMSDPKTKRISKFFEDGIYRAEEHLERLRETKLPVLEDLWLECGNHRMAVSEALQTVVEELRQIGFSIFSQRIAPLGLHESKARQLYFSSADYVRFEHPDSCKLNIRSLGIDDAGTLATFCDEAAETLAGRSNAEAARLAELQPLLESGRRELAKLRKASAAAAA